MSLAHLHMTYAAAAVSSNHTSQATNARSNLIFNQTGLSIPRFTNPGLPNTPSLQQQYQNHQNYINYQHHYNLQQQQHQPVQRSNFAINELLGLTSNTTNQHSQSYPSVGNSNSPSSTASSNSSSPESSDTHKVKLSANNHNSLLINEAAACAAAAAYGAYFRGGLMAHNFPTSFNHNSSGSVSLSTKPVSILKQQNASHSIGSTVSSISQVNGGSGPHSTNSDVSEDENLNEEDSFGKWMIYVYLVGF